MVYKLLAATGAVALLAATPTWASVTIRTGDFGSGTSYYDAFNYDLGPGVYHFTLSFSTPIFPEPAIRTWATS